MEIIKEIVLPVFNFKIKIMEEFNLFENRKNSFFYCYINDEKIQSDQLNLKYYKYKTVILYDVKNFLYQIYLNLEKTVNEKQKVEFRIYINSFEKNKIHIGNKFIIFSKYEITLQDDDETIKSFSNSVRESIKILIEQWKDLNITQQNCIKEF